MRSNKLQTKQIEQIRLATFSQIRIQTLNFLKKFVLMSAHFCTPVIDSESAAHRSRQNQIRISSTSITTESDPNQQHGCEGVAGVQEVL